MPSCKKKLLERLERHYDNNRPGSVTSLRLIALVCLLQVERAIVPAGVGEDVEMTALCYHSDSLLFSATSRGHVCAWHVDTRRCFMTWEADAGEIGTNTIYLPSGRLVWTQLHPLRQLWGGEIVTRLVYISQRSRAECVTLFCRVVG